MVLSLPVRHQCSRTGFRKIIIKPQPAGDLTWAKGSYTSASGIISSAWKIENDTFKLEVNIPPNATATVYIPGKANANSMKVRS